MNRLDARSVAMTQLWRFNSSAGLFCFAMVASFLRSVSPVDGLYHQTNDAIIIQADDGAEDDDNSDTHLVSPTFIKTDERLCLTVDDTLGWCTSFRSCYSVDRMQQLTFADMKAIALRGTCQYVRYDDEQKVYGVCCPRDDSGLNNGDLFGHPFFDSSLTTVDAFNGQLVASAKPVPWLQQPYGAQDIKAATSESDEEDKYDELDAERQSLICGAGPTQSSDSDWHRVVGGTDAVQNSWPFMVALRFSGKFLCAGSLISPTKILTAAHCVSAVFGMRHRLTVDLGMHHLTPSDAQVTRRVRRIKIFWGYNLRTKFNNDIAMLTMSSPVNFSSTISPVCLPPMGTREKYVEKEAAVIGWGSLAFSHPQPTVLQEAILRVTPNSVCKESYKTAGFRIADNSMLCAGAPGKDACRGDSGGPLVVRATPDSPWVQIGIVSFGIGCAREEYPGVFTRVSAFRYWIRFTSGV